MTKKFFNHSPYAEWRLLNKKVDPQNLQFYNSTHILNDANGNMGSIHSDGANNKKINKYYPIKSPKFIRYFEKDGLNEDNEHFNKYIINK